MGERSGRERELSEKNVRKRRREGNGAERKERKRREIESREKEGCKQSECID